METRLRSWTKSITWRIIGVVLLLLISWLCTHDPVKTSLITAVFHSIRVVMYYFHERAWLLVRWGQT